MKVVAIFAALVSLASAESVAESIRKIPKTWVFTVDGESVTGGNAPKISGTFADHPRKSIYLADYTNGYSNPRYQHCVLLDCIKEVRCTDFARYAQDHNGEDTECTMEHVDVADACDVHSRLNTYDYYQQWWFTVATDMGVNRATVQCYV